MDVTIPPATTWQAFVEHLAADRRSTATAPPVRALTDAFVERLLALLFPQFAITDRADGYDVLRDANDLDGLLVALLTPLTSNSREIAREFFGALPLCHATLQKDADAIFAGDPAAASRDEVIFAYPGFLATAVHRIAHILYRLDVPLVPRLLAEWAHGKTGIDIHPGAQIGASFAIDHGTGIVIGETSVIGERVRVYQGVTLGALAVSKRLAHKKRHPTLGNDVVVYANATILGGSTVVGDGSIIGGNVWLTSSVPPRSVVQFTSSVEQRPSDDGLEFHI